MVILVSQISELFDLRASGDPTHMSKESTPKGCGFPHRNDTLMTEPKQIENLRHQGSERVRPIAEEVLARAKEKMGLGLTGRSQ
jgi:hypothetical protein